MAIKTESEMAFPDIQNNVQVHHPSFGLGKIVIRTGTDENAKAIVKFKEEGEKKLALKHANLTVDKIDDEPEAEGESEE